MGCFGSPDIRTPNLDRMAAEGMKLTRRYTDEALAFIERNGEQPFFLYLAHNMPHILLAVSEEFRGKSEGGFYGDVIEEIDYNVGRILSKLKETGLDWSKRGEGTVLFNLPAGDR